MEVSNSLKVAMSNSIKFARSMGALQIESEHLLYGILTVEESRGTKLLNSFGISEGSYKRVILSNIKNDGNKISSDLSYSKPVLSIFAKSEQFCKKNAINMVEIEVVLYFLLLNSSLKATKVLSTIFKINIGNLTSKLEDIIGFKAEIESKLPSVSKIKTAQIDAELPEALKGLGINLTEKVCKNLDNEIIGRDSETARVIEILCRKTKNNPVLVGEAGVGKSSVVEGLARKIALGDVPEVIQGKIIFSMDMASLMAGTKFRGSMEQKLKDAISAIIENDNIIVFIDEIHMLAEAGSKDGEISPSDILKPYLARGELRLVGATTLDEYTRYIEKDPALERRFQPVKVEEPTSEDTIKILKGIRSSFENFHGVKISDEAIKDAVNLSVRYITNRFLPDKAIDLIDEACSKKRVGASVMPEEVKQISIELGNLEKKKAEAISKQDYKLAESLKQKKMALTEKIEQIKREQLAKTGSAFSEVGSNDVREVVSTITNIPLTRITGSEKEKLQNLENLLNQKVIGQPEAVSVVAKAIKRSRAGINDPKRPIGSFLFLGSTGVGKTELTSALGDVMFDSRDAVIRFDMTEFMESHSISRLIGAPPGYVGHEDGGELTEAVKRKPYSIVLFDEIEKAHPDIYNILLQIFDEGRLTDSKGKLINFRNTIIILTSNSGVEDLIRRRKYEKAHPDEVKVTTSEFLMDKLRDRFKPELLNRIDSIVIFDTLTKESVLKIADIMIKSLVERTKMNKNIDLQITENAKKLVCDIGYDEANGARPLKRAIDREIGNPLADLINNGDLENTAILVDAQNGKFIFKVLC